MQSLGSLTEYFICQTQCGTCFSVYEYDKGTHIYVPSDGTFTRSSELQRDSRLSCRSVGTKTRWKGQCCSVVDEENWLRPTETVCDKTIACGTVVTFFSDPDLRTLSIMTLIGITNQRWCALLACTCNEEFSRWILVAQEGN